MKYPEFILAKYVPNLSRMEPRNIGIFLWWKGTLCAKFLDDIEAIRKKDRASYREFVSDWNRMIDNKAIETVRGKVVPTSSPLCLKTILENEEDSFLFVDAGHVSSAIKKSEIEEVTAKLFSDLVAPHGARERESRASRTLHMACLQILEETGITSREDFHTNVPIELDVFGVKKPFRFSYGLGGKDPNVIYQRVNITRDTSVASSTLMLHSLVKGQKKTRKCAFIYQSPAPDNDELSSITEANLKVLSPICEGIDLAQPAQAAKKILGIAASEEEYCLQPCE